MPSTRIKKNKLSINLKKNKKYTKGNRKDKIRSTIKKYNLFKNIKKYTKGKGKKEQEEARLKREEARLKREEARLKRVGEREEVKLEKEKEREEARTNSLEYRNIIHYIYNLFSNQRKNIKTIKANLRNSLEESKEQAKMLEKNMKEELSKIFSTLIDNYYKNDELDINGLIKAYNTEKEALESIYKRSVKKNENPLDNDLVKETFDRIVKFQSITIEAKDFKKFFDNKTERNVGKYIKHKPEILSRLKKLRQLQLDLQVSDRELSDNKSEHGGIVNFDIIERLTHDLKPVIKDITSDDKAPSSLVSSSVLSGVGDIANLSDISDLVDVGDEVITSTRGTSKASGRGKRKPKHKTHKPKKHKRPKNKNTRK